MKKKILLVVASAMLIAGCSNPQETSESSKGSELESIISEVVSDSGEESISEEPSPIKQYSISFYDENGVLLDTITVNEGSVPSYTYNKESDDLNVYNFLGWSTTLGGDVETVVAAYSDASYYAVVSKTNRTYTIKYSNNATTAKQVKLETYESFDSLFTNYTNKIEEHNFTTYFNYIRNYVFERIYSIEDSVDNLKTKFNEIYNTIYIELIKGSKVSTAEELCNVLKEYVDYLISIKNTYSISALAEFGKDAYSSLMDILNNENPQQELYTYFNSLVSVFSNEFVPYFTNLFNGVVDQLTSKIATEYTNLKSKLGVQEWITKFEELYEDAIASVRNQYNSFYDLYKNIDNVISNAKAAFEESFENLVNSIANEASNVLNNVGKQIEEYLSDNAIKSSFESFVSEWSDKVSEISNLDNALEVLTDLKDAIETFVKDTLATVLNNIKNEIISKYEEIFNKVAAYIENNDLLLSLMNLDNKIRGEVNNLTTIEDAKTYLKNIVSYATEEITEIANAQITLYKNLAISSLQDAYNKAKAKINNSDILKLLEDYYTEVLALINAVENIASAKDDFEGIIDDAKAYIEELIVDGINKLIEAGIDKAIEELDALVSPYLNALPECDAKDSLLEFYNDQLDILNAIDSLDDLETTTKTVINNTVDYLKTNFQALTDTAKAKINTLLASLKDTNSGSLYNLLPETIRPTYASNYVNASDVAYDFANSFVNVSDIKVGIGEQLNELLDSISRYETVRGYLSPVYTLLNEAFTLLGTFVSNNIIPAPYFVYENDNFNVTVKFDDTNSKLYVSFASKKAFNITGIGEITPTFEYLKDSSNDTVRIVLNDNNVLLVKSSTNKFDVTYRLGTENYAYYSSMNIDASSGFVAETQTIATGKIAGKDISYTNKCKAEKSGNSLLVAGKKADGMAVANASIVETYDLATGALIGYKIKEKISLAAYHTLWFNIKDICGFNTIKVCDKSSENDSPKSINDTYLNGDDRLMKVMYNKKLGQKTSRYYDVELRNQYFYVDDGEGNIEKTLIKIPMFFVQDDNDKDSNFTDTPTEFNGLNGIDISFSISASDLTFIRDSYTTYQDYPYAGDDDETVKTNINAALSASLSF